MLPKGTDEAVWLRMPNDLCISLKSSIPLLFALMRSLHWKNCNAPTQIEGFCRQVEKILGDGTYWWLTSLFICGLNISHLLTLHAEFFLPVLLLSASRGVWKAGAFLCSLRPLLWSPKADLAVGRTKFQAMTFRFYISPWWINQCHVL